ncbi:ATP-binding protein [Alginatibacterium sediminis]|uniref:ATP-binding protein n=1 Tax=Alginatibacterium sediminis TaxID=2164068 RepID=A0A420EH05_9ALTE|nr:ATP-binding protein [Alginatibacterium sediminis]RKF19836.1 ATP-binding protein [Alginatibacterium sediminis]
MNPFSFDKVSDTDQFCGRSEELARLVDLMSNQANVMLYGDRRYGKTSLILKAFAEAPSSILPIYVDLYSIVDEMDFARELYVAVEKATPSTLRSQTSKLLDILSRVKGVEFQPTRSGDSFAFKPSIEIKDFDKLLTSAIGLIEDYCQHSHCSHAVIAFDEFQQIKGIKKIKIDAKLRTISQSNRKLSFIFSGSKKSILRNLLNKESQPWHGMTTPMSIKGVEISAIKAFCEDKLSTHFQEQAFESLYHSVRGQTRLLLQCCYRFYAEQTVKPSKEDCERVLANLVTAYDDEFRDKFISYPPRLKKALKAIAYANGESVFSQLNLDRVNLTKQALNQSITALERLDDVSKVDTGSYQINNILFSLWLERTR